MSAEYGMGLALGMGVAVMVALVLKWFFRRGEDREKADYDERQQAVRGRAYLKGYRALVFSVGIYGLLDLYGVHLCQPYIGVLTCILISSVVFAVTVIRSDAYLSMRTDPRHWMILYVIIGGINLVIGILSIFRGSLMDENGLGSGFISLSIGVAFTIILAATVLHRRRSREEAEEE